MAVVGDQGPNVQFTGDLSLIQSFLEVRSKSSSKLTFLWHVWLAEAWGSNFWGWEQLFLPGVTNKLGWSTIWILYIRSWFFFSRVEQLEVWVPKDVLDGLLGGYDVWPTLILSVKARIQSSKNPSNSRSWLTFLGKGEKEFRERTPLPWKNLGL